MACTTILVGKGALDIGGFKGGIPEITGSAYITAFTDMVFDANDSIQDGFLVD